MAIIDTKERERKDRRAVLAAVRLPGDTRFEERLQELEGLAKACGALPVGTLTQSLQTPDPACFLHRGKVDELRDYARLLDADLIVFNNPLSPSQLANLAEALDAEVIDRTGLILDIFAVRARTAEARMQVDYAKLRYMLPRLTGLRTNLSRQGGTGAGSLSNRGAGEKKIELDRRRIEKRMTQLRRGLEELEKTRALQRRRRTRSGLPQVSLVGYTNAGKSTLMNRLLSIGAGPAPGQARTQAWPPAPASDASSNGSEGDAALAAPSSGKQVFAQDMLFATLDTAVRRIDPPDGVPFLLTDTVGFIDDLPTGLVKAFRSTLSEIQTADLLLFVVDCLDPEAAHQLQVTEQTVAGLNAADIPRIIVMNKADSLTPAGSGAHLQPPGTVRGGRVWISARTGAGLP